MLSTPATPTAEADQAEGEGGDQQIRRQMFARWEPKQHAGAVARPGRRKGIAVFERQEYRRPVDPGSELLGSILVNLLPENLGKST